MLLQSADKAFCVPCNLSLQQKNECFRKVEVPPRLLSEYFVVQNGLILPEVSRAEVMKVEHTIPLACPPYTAFLSYPSCFPFNPQTTYSVIIVNIGILLISTIYPMLQPTKQPIKNHLLQFIEWLKLWYIVSGVILTHYRSNALLLCIVNSETLYWRSKGQSTPGHMFCVVSLMMTDTETAE